MNVLLRTISLLFFIFHFGSQVIADNNQSSTFSFAIIADPQLSARESKNKVASDAWQTLELACEEINNMRPDVDFTIFLGDLVNTWEPRSVDNFRQSISGLKTDIFLVHGNHDGKSPYTGFKTLQQEYNDIKSTYYAFDRGKWHFVVLTCDFRMKDEELRWLEQDLFENKSRPTIIFQHLHFIPLGLSQLEFYGFDLASKNRLIDLMTRHGNVKYYFNGHVHNGIQPSVKMSKSFRGIHFVTVPTIIHTRPFGEEYPKFNKGLETGGYYMTVQIDGEKVKLNAHLTGEKHVYTYPLKLPVFEEKMEPRWNKSIYELPGKDSLVNGSFDAKLKGWNVKFRYKTDKNPAYVSEVRKEGNSNRLFVSTRSTPPESWANDEYTEVYQVLEQPLFGDLCLSFDYRVQDCANGGGFARVTAFDEKGKPLLFFFQWGENEIEASYFPRCVGFEILGKSAGWNYLKEMGDVQRALFVRLPIHRSCDMKTISVNLQALYDQAVKTMGAFSNLRINKVYLGLGTWVNKEIGSVSSAWFDNVRLGSVSEFTQIRNQVDYSEIFKTEFGQALETRVKSKRADSAH